MGTSKKRKKPSRNPAKAAGAAQAEEEFKATWIRTEQTIDGKGWMVTVELDEDTSVALSFDETVVYAQAVLTAAARAEYECAVLTQVSARVKESERIEGSKFTREAFMLVQDMRADQPPIDFGRMSGVIELAGGINIKGEPFLTVIINGEGVGQWTVRDARVHALALLEAHAVADLDQAYKRTLTGIVGLEAGPTDAMIDDLRHYRPKS